MFFRNEASFSSSDWAAYSLTYLQHSMSIQPHLCPYQHELLLCASSWMQSGIYGFLHTQIHFLLENNTLSFEEVILIYHCIS